MNRTHLTIHSQDGILQNSTMKSDIYFNFGSIFKNAKSANISIDNAQFPVSFYNVNTNNNEFKISLNGGGITSIFIDTGNYNSTTLLSQLSTQLTNAGITTITTTISSITGKLTFVIDSGYFQIHNCSSYPVLGFEKGVDYTSSLQTLVAPFPFNLLGTLKLKILSNTLNISGISSHKGRASILGEIPVTSSNFGLILFHNNTNISQPLQQTNLNGFNIQITDDYGYLINFNNADWSITFDLEWIDTNIGAVKLNDLEQLE